MYDTDTLFWSHNACFRLLLGYASQNMGIRKGQFVVVVIWCSGSGQLNSRVGSESVVPTQEECICVACEYICKNERKRGSAKVAN